MLRARGHLPLAAVTLAAAALAVLVAGCGGRSAPVPARPRTATATPATPTRTVTTTATTATATAPLPGTGRPPIAIGDKNYGEQFVLGELYRSALVAQGYTATLNRNIGPPEVTRQALKLGRLDLYPEYVDTFNGSLAGDLHRYRSAAAALAAARRHAAPLGLRLLDPTPFSDTSAVAVTPAFAAAHGLRTIADLAGLEGTLTLGGPPQFQTIDPGLPAMARVYGVMPAAFTPLDVGAQIDALAKGTVQAAAVGTTDGQLQRGLFVLLADPRHIFGWGNVVPVVRASVVAAEGPVFLQTVDAVSALLTEPVMRELNLDVEIAGQDPGTVARRFLAANGLLPPPTP